jgi:hypothetical protein
MAKKKGIDELSAEELYGLAKAREAEEREREREAMRAEVDKLKTERKAILARHRKELAAIDAKIRKLGGRAVSRGTRGSNGSNISASVIEILSDKKQHSTKDIQAELNQRGIIAKNLAQTLAYLKRQGKVKSPKRSIYALS